MIKTFIPALKNNTTLLSLNLASNALTKELGEDFAECIKANKTIIDFQFFNNEFSLEHTRKIQEYLRRNKAAYDAERLKEWKERKMMRGEDQALQNMYLEESSKKEQGRMEEEARERREKEIDEKWRKFLLDSEFEK